MKVKLNGTSIMVQVVVVPIESGVKLVPRYFEYQSPYPSTFSLIRELATRAGMSMEAVREAANAETWKNARAL